VAALDVVLLVLLNRRKRATPASERGSKLPWATRRNMYWGLIVGQVTLAVWLDTRYEISPWLLPLKAYIFAFPLGLLDLHFSSTAGVPLKVLLGAALWCSTVYVRQAAIETHFGREMPPVMVRSVGARTLAIEAARYIVGLPCIGMLSDLIFSPMHRCAHLPYTYQQHHIEHHEYTSKLTSLVLYHGTLLDDFLMPFSTSVGGSVYTILLGLLGLEDQAFSSVTAYLMVINLLFSHAHDIRCARLVAPLPDELNFVAYHHVHHLSPKNNFGLTEPSDKLWDWLLGVRTIRKVGEFGAESVPSKAE